jgi:alpha-glucosidase
MANREWWRGAVLYHVYPRSFFDSNGDGIGDLPGITQKLDYIASLGADAVWLSPFFISPMRDFGYDVADYRAVDPIFGALDDFDRLVARAHGLGLKILIDQVWCHSSDQHPWFRASRQSRDNRHADWYVWADPRPDGTPPNNWLSVFGGSAWSWEPRRRQYYLHHFLASQPQLNLRHPDVADALMATGRFWLERGVDGFRLDAIDFLMHDVGLRDNPARPPAGGVMPVKPFGLQDHLYDMLQPETLGFLERIRQLTDEFPGAVTLGEVSSQEGAFERVALYTEGRRRLHMAYTLRPLRGSFDRAALSQAINEIAGLQERGQLCWSFSNHDVERAVSRWNPARGAAEPDPAFARQLMALLLTLPGSISVYQGEELGLTEAELGVADLRDPFGITYWPEFRGRDGSRTPLPWQAGARNAGFSTGKPWLPVAIEHHEAAIDVQERDPRSLLNAWRRFIAWRRQHPALVCGRVVPLDLPEPLFGFVRETVNERVLAVFNLSDAPARLFLAAGAPEEIVPLSGHGLPLTLEPGVAVLPAHGCFFGALGRVEGAALARRMLEPVA